MFLIDNSTMREEKYEMSFVKCHDESVFCLYYVRVTFIFILFSTAYIFREKKRRKEKDNSKMMTIKSTRSNCWSSRHNKILFIVVAKNRKNLNAKNNNLIWDFQIVIALISTHLLRLKSFTIWPKYANVSKNLN